MERSSVLLTCSAAEPAGGFATLSAPASNAVLALELAAEEAKRDHATVLAAVLEDGRALQHAAAELQGNRDIVSAAVEQNEHVLEFAADALLEDETFAVEAREWYYFFRIVALSGRSCCIALHLFCADKRTLLEESCRKLGIDRTDRQVLLLGSDLVPDNTDIPDWPGAPALGVITDYQLVSLSAGA
mmetsp:Transcript_12450/g.28199  ORF Transcript_12450/g.28199 Transcript_12450/m.28199 type:complete len:187 (+) Transcript_12450:129-689(+)